MTDVNQLVSLAERAPPSAPDLPEEPLYVDPENPEVTSGSRTRRPWRIEGDNEAEWALRKKGEAEAEIARVLDFAAKAKAEFARRIDHRAAEIIAGQQRRVQFFDAVLLEWMDRARNLLVKGKQKSRKFLFGTVGWRAAPKKIVYDDEAQALAWARAQGVDAGFFRVTFALEKDVIKRHCLPRGIVPPGAHVEGGEDVPFVEADVPAVPELPTNEKEIH